MGWGKYLVWPASQDLLEGERYAMSYCDLSLTFGPDSVKMFSTVIFETYLPYDNGIWIAASEYYLLQGDITFYNCLLVS